MLPRHYAPRTPIEMHPTAASVAARAAELRAAGERVAGVMVGGAPNPETVPMPADATGYAAKLYDVLHELDRRGLTRILIELPPDTDEWMAVRDRLTRASAR